MFARITESQYMIVFLLQHLHVHSDGDEDVKVIGVYSSREEALAAVGRKSLYPGFCECPKLIDPLVDDDKCGFYIDAVTVDKDQWSDGFVAV